jgi:hypothetical protein
VMHAGTTERSRPHIPYSSCTEGSATLLRIPVSMLTTLFEFDAEATSSLCI